MTAYSLPVQYDSADSLPAACTYIQVEYVTDDSVDSLPVQVEYVTDDSVDSLPVKVEYVTDDSVDSLPIQVEYVLTRCLYRWNM